MRVLVCPVCNSTEIELDAGGYTGKYYCKKCGYVGSFILEVDEEELSEFLKARQEGKNL
jgi:transcription initiation factor TFIIIB Brf1 subunit/transcription initiation factor TFIIB